MLVRPAMKKLFCLKAKNALGRFAPSALPHHDLVQQYVSYVQAIPIKIRGLGTRTRCKITRGEQKQDGFFAVLIKLQPRVVTCATDGQGLREPAEVAEACGAVYV